jgi:hypothetical protein
MDAFAKHHQCTGQSIRRYVTYGGDYKEAMRPYLECGEVLSSASAAAPPPSLAEARKDYLRQHPEPSASDFLKFASAKGVRRFSGVNQLISGSEFVSQKPRAAVPGTTPEDNAARLAEHGGRVATSDCRIAAEAWNKLDPKTRAITDRAAFARKFGVTYQGMGRYVEFDGAYTQKMLDILKKESGGASGTSAERPPASQAGRVVQDPWIGEEPMHASATQAQNLAEETGHEVIAPAALAPPMPMQSATTDHLDLTEDEWATIPAVLEDATEEQWAMLQAALHEARSQSPSRP